MRRTTRHRQPKWIQWLRQGAVCVAATALLTGATVQAQSGKSRFAPSDTAMDRIIALRDCLPSQYAGNLDKLRVGLMGGWSATPSTAPPPSPEDYLASLDMDVQACELAMRMPDQAQREEIFALVSRDVAIKTKDCRKFGMGRLVPVRVTTKQRGAGVDNGWQVFYKWVGASLLQASEMRFPAMTSPATAQLPPGIYQIRVEKSGAAKQPLPVIVTVGAERSQDIEIGVP